MGSAPDVRHCRRRDAPGRPGHRRPDRRSGRNDLVLLGTDGTYFLHQNAAGPLEVPVKEAGLPEGAIAIEIRDFTGNGRKDLLYFCDSETTPFCFRFQTADGRLGPEVRCKAPADQRRGRGRPGR